ncbi:MAG TPA: histidine triad nucleotide-binding protein [bacterium]|nr:histidine triad nucleotide-binding protein [bacterium]
MDDCIFCRIVSGKIPAQRVYEDEAVLAIRDINPQAPVHLLVLPKKHLASVQDASKQDAPLIGALTLAAVQLARAEGLDHRGFRLVINVGPEGGQTVPHLHMHLLGGRQMKWPPG